MRPLRRFKLVVISLVSLLVLLVASTVVLILIVGWHALFPEKLTTQQRLQQFPQVAMPLDQPATIYWDMYQIPFIEAATDHDAAFCLGLVHAHLRSGQIDFLKKVSQGRLSEMFGPITREVDAAVQTLDLGYAADDIIDSMDEHTRTWLESFVAGINFYRDHTDQKPPESGLFGLSPEPFTLRDLVTLGRLAGADVNWFVLFAFLKDRDDPEWQRNWDRAVQYGTSGSVSFKEQKKLEELRELLVGMSRSGSNSIAIGPSKTANGSAMIANDPHLGISIPNLFLLVGLKSPSYHTVGMMIPALPFTAIGRNESIAWGGTNMRAASSDLYDVSGTPDSEIETTEKKIKTRWWPSQRLVTRRTKYGPIITDADIIPSGDEDTLALQWVGHQVSDDIGAFLRADRAATIAEFVEAFRGYAVSAQNMLVVDTLGNIAMTMATRLPVRTYTKPQTLVLDPYDPADRWQGFLEGPDLPVAVNPPEGFIASANNKPTDNIPPIGFFFSETERIDRLKDLVGAADHIDLEFIKRLQTDTYSANAAALAKTWRELIGSYPDHDLAPGVISHLNRWDGRYLTDSRGPVAFELFTYHVANQVLGEEAGTPIYRSWAYIANFLPVDLKQLPDSLKSQIIDTALVRAERDFGRFKNWGEMHRMRAGYFLAWVPLLGQRFVYDEYPASGSRETIMKTNHELSNQRSSASYGSQSRHVSFMNDPDSNFFVLFGGNDGWLGSDNLVDQVGLWRDTSYIQLPLTLKAVQKRTRYRMTISPDQPTVLQEQR